MTSTQPRKRKNKTVVGVITVHLDPAGFPCAFTDQDGNPAECICQEGIRCEYHVTAMRQKASPGDAAVYTIPPERR